jgi:hypothetical protein
LRRLMAKRDRRAYRRERYRAGLETWASLGPEAHVRAKARSAASLATYHGKLKRQPCEVCGATGGVERHHPDYSKPLAVEWLCPEHHRERERANAIDQKENAMKRQPGSSFVGGGRR